MRKIFLIFVIVFTGCGKHVIEIDGLTRDDYIRMDKESENINKTARDEKEKKKMMDDLNMKYKSIAKERNVLRHQ